METCWSGKIVTDTSINVAISNIRACLARGGIPRLILTTRGVGYCLSESVTIIEAEAEAEAEAVGCGQVWEPRPRGDAAPDRSPRHPGRLPEGRTGGRCDARVPRLGWRQGSSLTSLCSAHPHAFGVV